MSAEPIHIPGMIQGLKKCAKCGRIKPTKAFNARTKSPDGFQPWCRACQTTARQQERGTQLTLVDTPPTQPHAKKCYACERFLHWSDFLPAMTHGKLPMKCRECVAKDAAARPMQRSTQVCKGGCGRRRARHDFPLNSHDTGRREAICRYCTWERRNQLTHPQRALEEAETPTVAEDTPTVPAAPQTGSQPELSGVLQRAMMPTVDRLVDQLVDDMVATITRRVMEQLGIR